MVDEKSSSELHDIFSLSFIDDIELVPGIDEFLLINFKEKSIFLRFNLFF